MQRIEIQHIHIAIGAAPQPGCLVLADGALLAVFSCENGGLWVLEAVFGTHHAQETPPTFSNVKDISAYFEGVPFER